MMLQYVSSHAQIIALIAFGFFARVRLKSYLHLFQQEEYDNLRFSMWIGRTASVDRTASAVVLLVWLLALSFPQLSQVIWALSVALTLLGVSELERRHQKTAKKPLVLVIEDEIQIRRLLRVCLERNDYEVVEATTGDEGIGEAVRRHPDAVLLDLGLPDMDGLAVLKRLREWSQVPVLVISVRGHEEDKISALDNGADDYVTKPFSTGEVLARLRVARRHKQTPTKLENFHSGNLEVDLTTRTVKVKGRKIKLTATEYSLLLLFIKHAGKVLTHGQILREVWETNDADKIGHLRVYMAYLREKLETNPAEPELLITEPGVGYRLVVPD